MPSLLAYCVVSSQVWPKMRAAIGWRQQGQGLVVGAVGAFGLEAHQRHKAVRVFAVQNLVRLHVKLLQLVDGDVDASAHRILAHIADDVGELEGQAQLVRVLRGGVLGLAKDMRRHLAHHAGH